MDSSIKPAINTKRQYINALSAIGGLSILYYIPLSRLLSLALGSDLYSHTMLIPFVSVFLIWSNRDRQKPSQPNFLFSLPPLLLGLFFLYKSFTLQMDPTNADVEETYVALSILSYICFCITILVSFIGIRTIKLNLFPILFLFFTAPFTYEVKTAIQTFFQHSSAELAYWLIKSFDIPVFRDGLIFEMPTITMEVAPQCSGIRSSLVLFIVCLLASYLFLKSPWKRAIFASLFIPLGIIRNGIRILVLAYQCYHIGPEQIDGWFHRQGGQPLFAITLLPLFGLLFLFWRSENKKESTRTETN